MIKQSMATNGLLKADDNDDIYLTLFINQIKLESENHQ